MRASIITSSSRSPWTSSSRICSRDCPRGPSTALDLRTHRILERIAEDTLTRRQQRPYLLTNPRRTDVCKLCDEGLPQNHTEAVRDTRRDFLKSAAAAGIAAAGLELFATQAGAADNGGPPE